MYIANSCPRLALWASQLADKASFPTPLGSQSFRGHFGLEVPSEGLQAWLWIPTQWLMYNWPPL